MDSTSWETPGRPDEAQEGLTRREALRRGTLAGIGLVWATPQVVSYRMTPQLAQATSPVTGTTIPGSTTEPPEQGTSTTEPPEQGTSSIEPEIEDEVSPTTVSRESPEEIEDEVLSSELPFTGLPLEQLLPLAGGAVATGAAAVRLAREHSEKTEVEEEETTE